jgi:hypothetical protein
MSRRHDPECSKDSIRVQCKPTRVIRLKRRSRSSARNAAAARGWSRARRWPASGRVSGTEEGADLPQAARPARAVDSSPRSSSARPRSSSAAICAVVIPCSDISTITARAAWCQGPRRAARSRSISQDGPLANTLTGRILITTSPGDGRWRKRRCNIRRG